MNRVLEALTQQSAFLQKSRIIAGIIVAACFFALTTAQAQSFEWTQLNDTFQNGAPDTNIYYDSQVKNLTNESIGLRWRVIEYSSTSTEWAAHMFDGYVAYPYFKDLNGFTTTVIPLDSLDSIVFQPVIHVMEEPGEASLVLCLHDTADSAGTYSCKTYRAVGDTIEVVGLEVAKPQSDYSLDQNVPNPFTNHTTISYSLPNNASDAMLKVHDKTGRVLLEAPLNPKASNIKIDKILDPGLYIYSMWKGSTMLASKRMIVD